MSCWRIIKTTCAYTALNNGLSIRPKAEQTRRYCATHNAPEDYTQKIAERSAETICNIAITLILQTDVMIKGLIEWQKNHFKDKGGIKELLYNERRKQRGY